MKTILTLLNIIFLCHLSAIADNKITVNLETRTEGSSYSNYLLWNIKNGRERFQGIPPKLSEENSVIKYFSLAKNDSVFILLGDLDSLNRVCIMDINRNLDFSDDYVYQFDKQQITNKTNFPAQLIAYKREIEGKEVIKQTFFRPQLFDSHSLKVERDNDLFHKYFVTLSIAERYEGYFHLQNKAYKTVILGDMYSQFMRLEYAVADSSSFDMDSLSIKKKIVGINEKILLDNFLIENVSLADNNSKLTLYIKNFNQLSEKERGGYMENFYALPFRKKDINGKSFNLDNYKGKYVLFDFWGTWCNPCIKLLPHIAAIHRQYTDLQIVSIALEMDEKGVEQIPIYIEKYGMNWINIAELQNDKNIINRQYNISSYPTTILVDPTGKIIHRGGSSEMAKLDKKLKEVFSK